MDFGGPSKSEGAPKTAQKIEYGDFLAPLGGQKAEKGGFGRRLEKTWNFYLKSMRKWEVFDGSEPRLALYSSLISHFRDF